MVHFEGCGQRAPEGVTSDKLVTVWVDGGLEEIIIS